MTADPEKISTEGAAEAHDFIWPLELTSPVRPQIYVGLRQRIVRGEIPAAEIYEETMA